MNSINVYKLITNVLIIEVCKNKDKLVTE